MTLKPICPYCKTTAKLVDSAIVYRGKSYGMIWDCRPCDAYVGVHKGTENALGTLANRELRVWRVRAHAAFDPLWKTGRMDRRAAYGYLAEVMGVEKQDAHISHFSKEQCERLVSIINRIDAYGKRRVLMKISPVQRRSDFSLLDCCHHVLPWEHCEHTAT